LCSVDSN